MRGLSSRGQHRQERGERLSQCGTQSQRRRAKKAVRSRQLRLLAPRRRGRVGKTRCRLSFFLFFYPFAYRRYRVLSFVTIPSARRHFLRIDISFILAVLLHFFFNEREIRILEVKKNCQMDKNKLVPLENLVRRIKRWRFTMYNFHGEPRPGTGRQQFTDS